ncbi:MAG: GIY-YIG nuclease family protein, partial [Ekhidna sp.]|nr:GIY-YIG nuclease family protein [Ekhidna sp.]
MNPVKSNIANRTLFCHDNLEVLRGINSACIDLIYLDPPFNKKKTFTAPIGSSAEGASFSDIFREEDVKEDWLKDIKEDHYAIHKLLSAIKDIEGKSSYNFCYLAYMAVRLMECHRVLKDTGSLYLHCDPVMSHYLKLLLDCIFGEKKFRNEIVWCYKSGGTSKRYFSRKHDIIFFYSKESVYNFNLEKEKSYGQTGGGQSGKVKYYQDEKGAYSIVGAKDWWQISMLSTTHSERTGYPTQKPLALLERIIKASSPQDGMVLDPFCGCATTCVAAERLKRKWIGIDVSVKAYELVKERLGKEVENKGTLFYEKLVRFNTDPPIRDDKDAYSPNRKYVYIISHPQYEGEYKVGIASNVKSRLNSYQTADPERSY